jgi:hypothetical protein
MWVAAGKVHLAVRAAQRAYQAAPGDASCSGLLLMVQQAANMGMAAEQEQQQGDGKEDGAGQRQQFGEGEEEDSEREEGRLQQQLGRKEEDSGEEAGQGARATGVTGQRRWRSAAPASRCCAPACFPLPRVAPSSELADHLRLCWPWARLIEPACPLPAAAAAAGDPVHPGARARPGAGAPPAGRPQQRGGGALHLAAGGALRRLPPGGGGRHAALPGHGAVPGRGLGRAL